MRDMGPRGWGLVQQAAPSDPCLWQIHWAASTQRIKECMLSGKDGNVSAVGSTGGVGGQGAGDPREAVGLGRHLGTSLAFPLAPG